MGKDQGNEKEKKERLYIDEARQASEIFPDGALVRGDGPDSPRGPDFLLLAKSGTIGIELTELCREDPRAEAARLRKVPGKAKKDYSRRLNAEPVDVSLAFSETERLDVKQMTKSLAEFVYTHRNDRRRGFDRDLPEGYGYIGISEPREPTGRWESVEGFDTVIVPKELLENRIAEKNQCLPDYRVSTPDVWLLIVNALGPGEVYVRRDDLAAWRFTFDFEKVLLFLREPGGRGEVIELREMSKT